MWFCHQFIKAAAKATLSNRMRATEDKKTQREESLTAFCQLVSYLLEVYENNGVIAETKPMVMSHRQRGNMHVIGYSYISW